LSKYQPDGQHRPLIHQAYHADEARCVDHLLSYFSLSEDERQSIVDTAQDLVTRVRDARKKEGGIDAFMQQYDLSSEEGIALMCLAEALLRVPDGRTIDHLLSDKIGTSDWKKHVGASDSLFVNAATWSLMLTGKLYSPSVAKEKGLLNSLKKVANRSSGAMIRQAVRQGMKVLGNQFVMGRTIEEALKRAKVGQSKGYTYSYDMLGEAAYTESDAKRYYQAYHDAINVIGKKGGGLGVIAGPGLSVKLSALHPRYEFAKRDRLMKELVPRLKSLAILAKSYDMSLTVDAEEADRLDVSLDIIEVVFLDSALEGWDGFGLAVQSYQKRAFFVLDYLASLAKKAQRRLMVRLVKGAYWDSEIKIAQVEGFESYPVFTRKESTDVSYLACAKKLLSHHAFLYPMFATHNAHTVSTILHLAQGKAFEFQCLHGMGQFLYDEVVGKDKLDLPCRIYAPVGAHESLLAYLVRRLLENGANTSFVNRITDTNVAVEEIAADPWLKVSALDAKPNPHIPLPLHIYGEQRLNAKGINLVDPVALERLDRAMKKEEGLAWHAEPTVLSASLDVKKQDVCSPTDGCVIGSMIQADEAMCRDALQKASQAFKAWDQQGVAYRSACLEKLADALEQAMAELIMILVKEAGKTIPDAVAEVREAVDFCRYYAIEAREHFAPKVLRGPTGESNTLYAYGRGPILCISPWNFPLAIFTGQMVAALVAGNPVLVKPADPTPLIAARVVSMMHQLGFPKEVVQLLPGRGSVIGGALLEDPRLKGVVFTGSTEVAQHIHGVLAQRGGEIVPLIAETGGQNVMLVDSSALPEQVVVDVVQSAFGSAGQRCSALRILLLQEDIADKMIEMLVGAMAELSVGDPVKLCTDVGPVIDARAQGVLQVHFERMSKEARLLYQVPVDARLKGHFFAPAAFELDDFSVLEREVFGPILHVVRFKASKMPEVVDKINRLGYGLTFGVHSRINQTVDYLCANINVGNIYVNRNMVGAVVGVQPFGGQGLSGTGPKAGGPQYIPRLSLERTVSIDTTAAGGNASLLSLPEDE
jgi:RHH-type proline utilization regulon transcriptional repressor/proline dehydrogenase/delta 1-pyrroline-5-carboxylate dehydrogenase